MPSFSSITAAAQYGGQRIKHAVHAMGIFLNVVLRDAEIDAFLCFWVASTPIIAAFLFKFDY